MCHRTKQRRIRERHSATRPLVHPHWARRVQLLQTNRPEIETRCSGPVQSLEMRRYRSGFETQGSSCAIRFRKTSQGRHRPRDRKSTRLNSSHMSISYAVFCLKKKKKKNKNVLTKNKKTIHTR